MKNIYVYVLRFDDGFAPNPFYGKCTLACCKPVIRKNAKVGDWVIGTTAQTTHGFANGIVYLMRVSKVLSFMDYYLQYPEKRSNLNIDLLHPYSCYGDNIYKPNENYYELMPNYFHYSLNEEEKEKFKKHDLSGENVLVSDHFYYFGSLPLLPDYAFNKNYSYLFKKNQGHKKHDTSNRDASELINEIKRYYNLNLNKVTAMPWEPLEITCDEETDYKRSCSDIDNDEDINIFKCNCK